MTDKVLMEIGADVADLAESIFAECGSRDDFGHQTGLVFGGLNRVILTARGFKMDRSYCSPRFKKRWDELNGSDYWRASFHPGS